MVSDEMDGSLQITINYNNLGDEASSLHMTIKRHLSRQIKFN